MVKKKGQNIVRVKFYTVILNVRVKFYTVRDLSTFVTNCEEFWGYSNFFKAINFFLLNFKISNGHLLIYLLLLKKR